MISSLWPNCTCVSVYCIRCIAAVLYGWCGTAYCHLYIMLGLCEIHYFFCNLQSSHFTFPTLRSIYTLFPVSFDTLYSFDLTWPVQNCKNRPQYFAEVIRCRNCSFPSSTYTGDIHSRSILFSFYGFFRRAFAELRSMQFIQTRLRFVAGFMAVLISLSLSIVYVKFGRGILEVYHRLNMELDL